MAAVDDHLVVARTVLVLSSPAVRSDTARPRIHQKGTRPAVRENAVIHPCCRLDGDRAALLATATRRGAVRAHQTHQHASRGAAIYRYKVERYVVAPMYIPSAALGRGG